MPTNPILEEDAAHVPFYATVAIHDVFQGNIDPNTSLTSCYPDDAIPHEVFQGNVGANPVLSLLPTAGDYDGSMNLLMLMAYIQKSDGKSLFLLMVSTCITYEALEPSDEGKYQPMKMYQLVKMPVPRVKMKLPEVQFDYNCNAFYLLHLPIDPGEM